MRGYLLAVAVILLTGLLWAQSARPGDAPYTPTKLEWAALEMQVRYGRAGILARTAIFLCRSDLKTMGEASIVS